MGSITPQHPSNLLQLLERTAHNAYDKGISVYAPGRVDKVTHRLSYPELLREALSYGFALKSAAGVRSEGVVLIHLDNHRDNIRFLWATIAAGLVPAISTPFTSDLEQRKKHLAHLDKVLGKPVIITSERLVPEFLGLLDTQIRTTEELGKAVSPNQFCNDGFAKREDDLAALMLTSGSTGNAKAVTLRHGQVIKAVRGKSIYHGTVADDVFLNWIGMDHVANLTEIHLHAMSLGANQIHVQAADLIAEPMSFLRLIERHNVAYSFAPNFFLASVKKALEAQKSTNTNVDFHLPSVSSLRALISGGEANSTALCSSLTSLMIKNCDAPDSFIRPGFGMTETCAGSIYNKDCPSFDLAHGREFTSLGHCVPGISMRITNAEGKVLSKNEPGNLEVSGDLVFNEYYNNPEATASSFTKDGWFSTGDLAFLDDRGNLHMVGRGKETIIINGVKYYPHEVETAIEDSKIEGVTPSFTAVFPHRAPGADSETLCVVYLPSYNLEDVEARVLARNSIRNVVMKHCLARPFKVIPLTQALLPKTALGKLSRNKIKTAFESGVYKDIVQKDQDLISSWEGGHIQEPTTKLQVLLREILSDVFELPAFELGINTNFYDAGLTSLEIFKIKSRLQNTPGLPDMIPITTLISNPTIELLAEALDPEGRPKEYDPVVVLRSEGKKTPLWLVHPGVGEVLVFLNLAKQVTDRPVYALRARGFDGEPFFTSVEEMATVYKSAMRRKQPKGPYAVAGYSYGGTLAFEVAKLMQQEGQEVPFLAVFDQPPHIKERMRHGDWADVLLTLSRFFELLPDQKTEDEVATRLRQIKLDEVDQANSQAELVEILLSSASTSRLEEFGLDKKRLQRWTSLALNSHIIARDYEPAGLVPLLEVFYAQPISAVAKTKQEWLEKKLSKWQDFVKDVQFHEMNGHHYDLISPAHVALFWKALETRLTARGV